MAQIDIKQGGSLIMALQFSNDDGSTADLTGFVASSQLRNTLNGVVAEPTVYLDPPNGLGLISVTDTSHWPTGVLRCDLKLTGPGDVLLTETFSVRVARSVTQ